MMRMHNYLCDRIIRLCSRIMPLCARTILLCICIMSGLFPSPARANPADAFGFGSRAAALGGAATAIADDASANYYNPAGLVRGRDLRIDLGYQAALPYLYMNGRNSQVDPTHGFSVGIAAPGAIGPIRVAFGAALFLPDDRLTRVRSLAFAQPRWVYYDNRTQRIFLAANLALQIVRGLYVGGGLAFMSRTQGTVALQGNIAVTDTDQTSSLVKRIDVDLVAVRYPQAGIVFEPTGWLTLAASYRHSFILRLDQGFAINGSVGNPGLMPIVANGSFSATSESSDLFQPWQLTLAVAARVTPRLLISFDATYAGWSQFETPAATLDIKLDLGATLNKLVHLPPPRSYPAPGFHDILIPRLGVEYRALAREKVALDLRAGYAYEPSPAPEQVGESNYVDCDKHHFSVGAGIETRPFGAALPRPLSIDAHVAVTYLPDRFNRKVDPLDPVGDYAARGTVVELGLTTRWRF